MLFVLLGLNIIKGSIRFISITLFIYLYLQNINKSGSFQQNNINGGHRL